MDPIQPQDEAPSGGDEAAARVAGAYAVKLPIFEGPLDLLLHLIRQNEVEITDLPIAQVSEQYLDYLELMRELDLDVAGEYLVMAATMALIKSRMLLPSRAEEDEGEAIDPRAELVARLLDYQRYKEVAESLSQRRRLDRDVFRARGPEVEPVPAEAREIAVDLFQLLSAFREVLAGATASAGPHEVEVETVTVRERMRVVMAALESHDTLEFIQLFETPGGAPPSRGLLVATFLAILELSRLAALRVYQALSDSGAPSGPIRIRAVEDADEGPWSQRISQLM